jgi:alginate O-acetyltransferase complex protein AlgI
VGRKIGQFNETSENSRLYLIFGISTNLLLLITYKYANFLVENTNLTLNLLGLAGLDTPYVHLPLGISFFTFQALSYLIDVYRNEVKSQKSILDLGLYISLFPQLISGPIVRYHDIASQINRRDHSIENFAQGVSRFTYGLAKKVLIANPLAEVADAAFLLSGNELTLPLAWLGILAYSL